MSSSGHSHHVCPSWLGALLDNRLRACLQNPFAILRPFVRTGQRVADIGAGPGFFTLPLAELVGPTGRVFAVDIQPAMLAEITRKSRERGTTQVVTCAVTGPDLPLSEPVDFVLMFWMLHEVSSRRTLLEQVRSRLAPAGTVLFAEPKLHVSAALYGQELELFAAAGFQVKETVPARFSRAALLART